MAIMKSLTRTVPSGHVVVISTAPWPPFDRSGVPEMTPALPSSHTPEGSEPPVTVNEAGIGRPIVLGAIVSVEPAEPWMSL